jgi:hypothetical protein
MRPQSKVLMTAGALHTASLGAAAPASAATTTAPAPPASAATSGTWAATGTMNTTRFKHTSTLLPEGQVLVAGGDSALGASAELCNPASRNP